MQLFTASFLESILSSIISGLVIALVLEGVKAFKKSKVNRRRRAAAQEQAAKMEERAAAAVPAGASPQSYAPTAPAPAMAPPPRRGPLMVIGSFVSFVFHVVFAVVFGLVGSAVVTVFIEASGHERPGFGSPLIIAVTAALTALGWVISALVTGMFRQRD